MRWEAGAGTARLRTRAEHGVAIGDRTHRLVIRVEIEDDGRGVPEDLAERIFLPLLSTRAERQRLGPGARHSRWRAGMVARWVTARVRGTRCSVCFRCRCMRKTLKKEPMMTTERPPLWVIDDDRSVRFVLVEACVMPAIA